MDVYQSRLNELDPSNFDGYKLLLDDFNNKKKQQENIRNSIESRLDLNIVVKDKIPFQKNYSIDNVRNQIKSETNNFKKMSQMSTDYQEGMQYILQQLTTNENDDHQILEKSVTVLEEDFDFLLKTFHSDLQYSTIELYKLYNSLFKSYSIEKKKSILEQKNKKSDDLPLPSIKDSISHLLSSEESCNERNQIIDHLNIKGEHKILRI